MADGETGLENYSNGYSITWLATFDPFLFIKANGYVLLKFTDVTETSLIVCCYISTVNFYL